MLNHVNYLKKRQLPNKNFLKLKFQNIKQQKIKNYWPKEHNNSSNFTKAYIFDKKPFYMDSFQASIFNNLFEVI